MSMWTAITLIVIIGCLTGVAMQYLGAKAEGRANSDSQPDQHHQDLADELAGLKQRVETLEAIVTDRSSQLKRDIEDLHR